MKDKRTLYVNNDNTIIKSYNTTSEGEMEVSILNFLKEKGIKQIPEIIDIKDSSTTMQYYKGTRVFNLICTLERISSSQNEQVKQKIVSFIKKLLSVCKNNQIKLQQSLKGYYERYPQKFSVYPKEKLTELVDVLYYCYSLDNESISQDKLREQLELVYNVFHKAAIIPFRDATTKNMILNEELFFLDNKDLNEYDNNIKGMLNNDFLEKINLETSIIDIDFCSCIHLTTEFDDVISLNFHEKTFNYHKYEEITGWLEDSNSDTDRSKVIAATFIIRYLRFGGRKLLYRLLAKELYDIRFRHDEEKFYFILLPRIIGYYWEESKTELSELLNFFDIISKKMQKKEYYFAVDREYKQKIEGIIKKKPYEDIFI